jgi:hypothetical protein
MLSFRASTAISRHRDLQLDVSRMQSNFAPSKDDLDSSALIRNRCKLDSCSRELPGKPNGFHTNSCTFTFIPTWL